jgi:hypothetical protein
LKVFFFYTSLLLLLIVATFVFAKVQGGYFTIVKSYVAIEYTMFSLFFYYLLRNNIFKKITLLSVIPFWVFAIYNFIQGSKTIFDSTSLLIEFLLLIVIILFYFFEKLQYLSKNPMQNSISFWLCVGLLIYFFGNFFFVFTLNTSKDVVFLKQTKLIYSFVTIAKDIILALAWFGKEPIETDADIIRIPDSLDFDKDFEELRQNKNNKIS